MTLPDSRHGLRDYEPPPAGRRDVASPLTAPWSDVRDRAARRELLALRQGGAIVVLEWVGALRRTHGALVLLPAASLWRRRRGGCSAVATGELARARRGPRIPGLGRLQPACSAATTSWAAWMRGRAHRCDDYALLLAISANGAEADERAAEIDAGGSERPASATPAGCTALGQSVLKRMSVCGWGGWSEAGASPDRRDPVGGTLSRAGRGVPATPGPPRERAGSTGRTKSIAGAHPQAPNPRPTPLAPWQSLEADPGAPGHHGNSVERLSRPSSVPAPLARSRGATRDDARPLQNDRTAGDCVPPSAFDMSAEERTDCRRSRTTTSPTRAGLPGGGAVGQDRGTLRAPARPACRPIWTADGELRSSRR